MAEDTAAEAGPYIARQAGHFEPWEVWDADTLVFRLPAGFPPDLLGEAARIYDHGVKRGRQQGRTEAHLDIQHALGLRP